MPCFDAPDMLREKGSVHGVALQWDVRAVTGGYDVRPARITGSACGKPTFGTVVAEKLMRTRSAWCMPWSDGITYEG